MKLHRASCIVLTLSTLSATASADDTKITHPNRTAGTIVTTIAVSLLVSAPLSALLGYAISTANRDGAVMSAFGIASFSSGCLGIGMIIPGIALLTSHDAVAVSTPRAFTFPLVSASF